MMQFHNKKDKWSPEPYHISLFNIVCPYLFKLMFSKWDKYHLKHCVCISNDWYAVKSVQQTFQAILFRQLILMIFTVVFLLLSEPALLVKLSFLYVNRRVSSNIYLSFSRVVKYLVRYRALPVASMIISLKQQNSNQRDS